jgi:hypothetical protein
MEFLKDLYLFSLIFAFVYVCVLGKGEAIGTLILEYIYIYIYIYFTIVMRRILIKEFKVAWNELILQRPFI